MLIVDFSKASRTNIIVYITFYRLLNLKVLIFALEGTDLSSLDANLNFIVNLTFLDVYITSFK
jgi:hypothetical protein